MRDNWASMFMKFALQSMMNRVPAGRNASRGSGGNKKAPSRARRLARRKMQAKSRQINRNR